MVLSLVAFRILLLSVYSNGTPELCIAATHYINVLTVFVHIKSICGYDNSRIGQEEKYFDFYKKDLYNTW